MKIKWRHVNEMKRWGENLDLITKQKVTQGCCRNDILCPPDRVTKV